VLSIDALKDAFFAEGVSAYGDDGISKGACANGAFKCFENVFKRKAQSII